MAFGKCLEILVNNKGHKSSIAQLLYPDNPAICLHGSLRRQGDKKLRAEYSGQD